jgi:hypothetical protein
MRQIDLIRYFAYCIGLTLIGVLLASGWHDFFAASHASVRTMQTNSK